MWSIQRDCVGICSNDITTLDDIYRYLYSVMFHCVVQRKFKFFVADSFASTENENKWSPITAGYYLNGISISKERVSNLYLSERYQVEYVQRHNSLNCRYF